MLNAVVGIAIGIAVGYVVARLRKALDDAPTEITISLVTPYFAYLPAEALGVSAVLAAVTAGHLPGWHSPELITPATRIQAFSVWEILVFVLNAVLFMLVGLQLPSVIDGISGMSTGSIVVRRGRGLAGGHRHPLPVGLPGHLRCRAGSRAACASASRPCTGSSRPSWRGPGMRGAVSLAAALAIPQTIDGGGAFPQRDLIVFLTYAVILATLILQGLTLPRLIKVLGVEDDGNLEQRESKARILAARAALDRIEELREQDWVRDDTADRMRGMYDFRIRRFSARFDDEDDGAIDEQSYAYQRLRRKVLEAERAEIIRLRNVGKINDEIMRRIERDLDLEDTRLEV